MSRPEVMVTMGRWLAEKEIAGCSLSVIVAKGKKFGAFKFHLQGSEKKAGTVVGGRAKFEPLIVFINSKIILKCFFSIRVKNVASCSGFAR